MTVASLLEALYRTSLATEIRENEYAFPSIESVHVLAIAIVVGSIAIVDLRLLGLASRERPVSRISADVLPVTWTAFALAAVSGVLMFMSNAPTYSHNAYFRGKLILLALAGINMAVFQAFAYRGVASWDTARRTPLAARIAAACSLSLWVLIVAAGRWIGFTMLAGY